MSLINDSDVRGGASPPLTRFDANAAALFLLFLVFNAPDPSPAVRAHIRKLCADALPMLQSRRLDSLYYLAVDPDSPTQQAYEYIWSQQRAHACIALRAMTEARVDVHVFKGIEFIERHFGGRALSLSSDVDILVPQPDIAKAKSVLRELGYGQSDFDRKRGVMLPRAEDEIRQYEENSNELYAFNKVIVLPEALPESIADSVADFRHPVWHIDGRHYLIISIDVHHTLSRNLDLSDVYRRAVPSSLGVAKTLSPEDHFWFMALRYYLEVGVHGEGKKLRPLAYLCAMMRSGLAWPTVIEQVAQLKSEAALYYMTAFVAKLTGSDMPAILERVDPRAHSRVRDWGWQMPKLFGFVDRLPPEFETSVAGFRDLLH